MTDILKTLLIFIGFWLLISLVPKITDYFVKKRQNKFLSKILKADPIMKQLIERVEQKIKKKIRFEINPLSIFYDDYFYYVWGINRRGKLVIAVNSNGAIIPQDKDRQIFNLAHELAHLIEGNFKINNSCGYRLVSCLFKELGAHLLAAQLLKEINVEIGNQIFKNRKQGFWSKRLELTVDVQCEKCHQIVKEKKCPELQKILEYLFAIASDAGIKLIMPNPASSKKNGVISLIISEALQRCRYLIYHFLLPIRGGLEQCRILKIGDEQHCEHQSQRLV